MKPALSSPAALVESIDNRLARRRSASKDGSSPGEDTEAAALGRLGDLAEDAKTTSSGKVAGLTTVLREVGVGRRSAIRAVVFSERIRTLDWIAEAIRSELGMSDQQVEIGDVPHLNSAEQSGKSAVVPHLCVWIARPLRSASRLVGGA